MVAIFKFSAKRAALVKKLEFKELLNEMLYFLFLRKYFFWKWAKWVIKFPESWKYQFNWFQKFSFNFQKISIVPKFSQKIEISQIEPKYADFENFIKFFKSDNKHGINKRIFWAKYISFFLFSQNQYVQSRTFFLSVFHTPYFSTI